MVTTKSNILNATFRVVGDQNVKTMRSYFYVKNDIKTPVINKSGYLIDELDITLTGIVGLTGKVTERHNWESVAIKNAIILVKQNGYVVDKTISDDQGDYCIFVKSGVYDIEISTPTYKKVIRNYQIDDGINYVHTNIVDGDICYKSNDVVAFFQDDASVYDNWLVNGMILDPRNNPVDGAELVITRQNEVVVHYKTGVDGEYHFLLPFGNYDIRIRLPKEHVKISTNVDFTGIDGFLPKVLANLNR